jgi:nucleotide-binding universal stress UspA family protein
MKILVATDGSRAARAAVQFAAKLAANCKNGQLTVLAVATLRRDLAMTLPPAFFPAKSLHDLETGERESRRRDLEESVRGLETIKAMATNGRTMEECISYISKTNAIADDIINDIIKDGMSDDEKLSIKNAINGK